MAGKVVGDQVRSREFRLSLPENLGGLALTTLRKYGIVPAIRPPYEMHS